MSDQRVQQAEMLEAMAWTERLDDRIPEADALAAGAQALRDPSAREWQDISGAPKLTDVLVLVYTPYGSTTVKVARTNGNSWWAFPGNYSCKPTHWMPLPAPPQTKEQP